MVSEAFASFALPPAPMCCMSGDGAERGTDDDRNREVDDIASQDEIAKTFEHANSPDGCVRSYNFVAFQEVYRTRRGVPRSYRPAACIRAYG